MTARRGVSDQQQSWQSTISMLYMDYCIERSQHVGSPDTVAPVYGGHSVAGLSRFDLASRRRVRTSGWR